MYIYIEFFCLHAVSLESCHYLAQLGLRQLGLPAPKHTRESANRALVIVL